MLRAVVNCEEKGKELSIYLLVNTLSFILENGNVTAEVSGSFHFSNSG